MVEELSPEDVLDLIDLNELADHNLEDVSTSTLKRNIAELDEKLGDIKDEKQELVEKYRSVLQSLADRETMARGQLLKRARFFKTEARKRHIYQRVYKLQLEKRRTALEVLRVGQTSSELDEKLSEEVAPFDFEDLMEDIEDQGPSIDIASEQLEELTEITEEMELMGQGIDSMSQDREAELVEQIKNGEVDPEEIDPVEGIWDDEVGSE